MGDAVLELGLSADERVEEYHGEFSFDGSGPAEINTFESEDSNPEYWLPSGPYLLLNSETVTLYVAEDTGFRGTIHAMRPTRGKLTRPAGSAIPRCMART